MGKHSAWILILLTMVMCVSVTLSSQAALAEHSGSAGGTSWTLNDSGDLIISGSGEMNREAMWGWLSYADEIRTAEIGSGVTSICADAFGSCENLTDISIPDSVASIETSEYSYTPFADSPKLRAIHVSSDNPCFSSVDGILFDKSKRTLLFHPPGITAASYTVPGSVTKIGPAAFYESENLESIVIPNGVTYIGDGAFCRSGLAGALTIPSSVTYIGGSAFEGCGITAVTLPDGLTSLEDYVFSGCGYLADITIPSTVTRIGDNAFFWCESLAGITIPNGVASIGEYAFCGCTGFRSIAIPDSVTSIGNAAFCNCFGMADANGFVIVRGVLYTYCGSSPDVTVPQNVTRISDYAFDGSRAALTAVTLPNSVAFVDECAFDRCGSMTSVTVYNRNTCFIGVSFTWPSDSLTIYGWSDSTAGAYAAAHRIEFRPLSAPNPDFFLPASLTAIGLDAFSGITARAVVIPKNVTSITANPFAGSIVTAVYGYSGSAAETLADSFGYCFIAIDDAWMASLGN